MFGLADCPGLLDETVKVTAGEDMDGIGLIEARQRCIKERRHYTFTMCKHSRL